MARTHHDRHLLPQCHQVSIHFTKKIPSSSKNIQVPSVPIAPEHIPVPLRTSHYGQKIKPPLHYIQVASTILLHSTKGAGPVAPRNTDIGQCETEDLSSEHVCVICNCINCCCCFEYLVMPKVCLDWNKDRPLQIQTSAQSAATITHTHCGRPQLMTMCVRGQVVGTMTVREAGLLSPVSK